MAIKPPLHESTGHQAGDGPADRRHHAAVLARPDALAREVADGQGKRDEIAGTLPLLWTGLHSFIAWVPKAHEGPFQRPAKKAGTDLRHMEMPSRGRLFEHPALQR